MSCDYSVWHTTTRLSTAEAGELHVRLCEGDTSGVTPYPGIDAFYKELTAQHPEIDTIPEDQIGDGYSASVETAVEILVIRPPHVWLVLITRLS